MKDPLTILFVEDGDGHFADLQQMLAIEIPRLPIRVNALFARTQVEAEALLNQADAVMTDVFFPAEVGDKEAGNGLAIVALCLEKKKPVVWITSTYHHGTKTDPLNEWGCKHGLKMFDSCTPDSTSENDTEGDHKPWKSALLGLFYVIVAVESGAAIFKDGCIIQSRNGHGLHHCMYDIHYYCSGEGDLSREPVLIKMKEEGFPLD